MAMLRFFWVERSYPSCWLAMPWKILGKTVIPDVLNVDVRKKLGKTIIPKVSSDSAKNFFSRTIIPKVSTSGAKNLA